jgi:hypothetical protein
MDELRKHLVERVGLAEDRAEAAIQEILEYLTEHLPEPAARAIADFAARPTGLDEDEQTKTAVAAVAATTAAVNVVVLPGAH